ncbi:MAG TPA: hypothetical protein VHH73_11245 [Verrucomicrobiae bacterium]|nr:hypothetical protein [Verrucomicrobiae bacterium]
MKLIGLTSLVLTWAGLFGLARELAARGHWPGDWRFAWIGASLIWGALIALVVEITSAFHQLHAPALIACWMFLAVTTVAASFFLARRRGMTAAGWGARWKALGEDWDQHWPGDAKILTGGTLLFLGVTLLIGVITPTTNWDSLTYHLPRVMHWLQQQSVAHFPTNNTRQIEFAPWSGFTIATLQLFAGGDRLANLVQWFALVTSAIGASLIAGQLLEAICLSGREATAAVMRPQRLRAATLAAFLVATLPIALVESITTQTDCVVAGWLICLVALANALARAPENPWLAAGVGLALALGLLSKATMFVYAAPLGIALVSWWVARVSGWRLRMRMAATIVVIVLVLDGPHWARNFRVFGSPLGSREILSIERNEHVSMGATASNAIRNLLLETSTGIAPLTRGLNQFLLALHQLTGRDLNDPATTYHLGEFEAANKFVVKDSEASNPWHLALIVAALALALRAPRRNARILQYAGLFLASFLIFCALLRWQRWHTRIHLGFLVALLPMVAAMLTTLSRRWPVALAGTIAGVFAAASLLANESRPLRNPIFAALPREAQYTAAHGFGIYEGYRRLAEEIQFAGCRQVGLKFGFDDAEYPLWVTLSNRGYTGRIGHCGVENESARIPGGGTAPDMVVTGLTNLPPALAAQFPFGLDYGTLRAHWSESMSRWARLEWFDTEKEISNYLAHEPRALPFRHGVIGFYLRAPRGGTLHLSGRVVDGRGEPVKNAQLRLMAYGGFQEDVSLDWQPVTVRVPAKAGTTHISWGIFGNSPGETRLDKFEWTWQPDGTP